MHTKTPSLLAFLAIFCGVHAQNGSLTDLPSYMTHINATRNDRSPVVLNIDTQDTSKRNDTAPYLYGIMFEDISHSGDGGIYAELLANRAFQGSNWNTTLIPDFNGSLIGKSENPVEPIAPVLTAWAPIGDNVRMTLDRLHPLSSALPTGMQIDFPENATGEVGFQNFGLSFAVPLCLIDSSTDLE